MKVATGVLMGDETISNREKSPYLEVKTTTSEYAEYLDNIFGIFSAGFDNTGKSKTSFTDKDFYRWSTRTHNDLSEFSEWYSNGEKRFPCDTFVDDVVLRGWYVCDGNYGNSGQMRICCANESDRLEEVSQFINCDTYTTGEQIVITTTDARNFLGSTEPIPGFEHKWP